MASITTSSGITYPINWCSSEVMPGELFINMPYSGRLPGIAYDFDECETFTVNQDGKTKMHIGYTCLKHISADDAKSITVRVKKDGDV